MEEEKEKILVSAKERRGDLITDTLGRKIKSILRGVRREKGKKWTYRCAGEFGSTGALGGKGGVYHEVGEFRSGVSRRFDERRGTRKNRRIRYRRQGRQSRSLRRGMISSEKGTERILGEKKN